MTECKFYDVSKTIRDIFCRVLLIRRNVEDRLN
jgi:hypothetical protein